MSEKQQGKRHERIHTGFSYYDGHQIRDQDLLDRGDRICRSPRDSDGPDRSRADHGPRRRGDHVKEVSGYAAARRPFRSHGVHGSGQLGIKTTSFVAVIGTVTLAFSLAMQNTLSNFAGGTLILLLKPFKVGDYISTSAGEGTVETIGLVYTTLLTVDNRVITIPNSSVSSAPLTNLTRMGKRRLIINVGIGYSSDLLKAKNVLKQIFEENPYIMKDQDIQVIVDSLGDSSVNLSARGWVLCEDYWKTKWAITEEIKLTFDREGIEIPYQYMNVTLTKESQ